MDDHIRLCTLDWDAYTRCARQAAAEGIRPDRMEYVYRKKDEFVGR